MSWRVDIEHWKEYLDDLAARIQDRQARGECQLSIHPKVAERLVKEARLMERIRQAEDDTHDLETLGERVADIIYADEQSDKEDK